MHLDQSSAVRVFESPDHADPRNDPRRNPVLIASPFSAAGLQQGLGGIGAVGCHSLSAILLPPLNHPDAGLASPRISFSCSIRGLFSIVFVRRFWPMVQCGLSPSPLVWLPNLIGRPTTKILLAIIGASSSHVRLSG